MIMILEQGFMMEDWEDGLVWIRFLNRILNTLHIHLSIITLIRFIDKNGEFVISADLKDKYKNLEATIKIVYDKVVEASQEDIDKICKVGGFVDRQEILDLLTPDNGPVIDVQDITDFDYSTKRGKVTEKGKELNMKKAGYAVTNGDPSSKMKDITITIDEAVATALNITKGVGNKEIYGFNLQIWIHELTHAKQIENGKDINEADAYTVEITLSGRKSVETTFANYEENTKIISANYQNDNNFIGPKRSESSEN